MMILGVGGLGSGSRDRAVVIVRIRRKAEEGSRQGASKLVQALPESLHNTADVSGATDNKVLLVGCSRTLLDLARLGRGLGRGRTRARGRGRAR